jgi:TRAP-type C4-dicarboxylate transport system permease large subunit
VVFALSLGTITPPVGNVLFVGARVAGLRVEPVIMALVPFFLALTFTLLVVTFVPQLSLWLPEAVGLLE